MIAKRRQWAWLVIALLAVASRLLGLEATPLAPSEASQAIGAWDVVSRGVWPTASESPLLLAGQALLFTLAPPSGWTARLFPALAGIGLIGLPFLWRREIGDLGALVASSLLLISPLSIFAAHRSHSATIAILGSGLIVTAVLTGTDKDRQRPKVSVLAVGLTLGLTGGPAFYDALIAAGFTWLVLRRRGNPTANLPWRRAVLIGLGAALIIAVAGGWHWAGWAGVLDSAAAWLYEWRGPADRGLAPLELLLLYEPVLLIATLTGLGLLIADAESHRKRAPWALALWGASAALLIAARPESPAEGVSLIVLPLALFGGWAANAIWRGDIGHDGSSRGLTPVHRQWVACHALVSALFWVPGLVALAQNARGILRTDQLALIVSGLIVLIALQVLLAFIFLMRLPSHLVWRGALTGFALIFVFIQVSFATGLGFVRSDQAIEPAIHTAGSRHMAHLTDIIDEIAVARKMRRDSLPIILLDRGEAWIPTLRWVLRDFGNVTQAANWPEESDALVLTAAPLDPPGAVTDQAWEGMRFVAATTYTSTPPRCQLFPLACSDALRWYLYREAAEAATPIPVILWRAAGARN